jgi:hypothetical protein
MKKIVKLGKIMLSYMTYLRKICHGECPGAHAKGDLQKLQSTCASYKTEPKVSWSKLTNQADIHW